MTSDRIVQSPAGYVPRAAICYGHEDDLAVSVDPGHPLPVADACYAASSPAAFDVALTPGRALLVVCTTPGNLVLRLADDSQLTIPVSTGLSILPFAVTRLVAPGTTAAVTCRSLG